MARDCLRVVVKRRGGLCLTDVRNRGAHHRTLSVVRGDLREPYCPTVSSIQASSFGLASNGRKQIIGTSSTDVVSTASIIAGRCCAVVNEVTVTYSMSTIAPFHRNRAGALMICPPVTNRRSSRSFSTVSAWSTVSALISTLYNTTTYSIARPARWGLRWGPGGDAVQREKHSSDRPAAEPTNKQARVAEVMGQALSHPTTIESERQQQTSPRVL